MEVSRSSWAEKRKLIKEAIGRCDYCALDFEFTGLNTGKHSAFHALDTSEERYAKAALAGKNFSVSQIGISCFTKLSEGEQEEEEEKKEGKGKRETEAADREKTSPPQKWRVKSFNAYLFPGYVPLPTSLSNSNTGVPALGQMHDERFMCQAASLNFLATAGFDFNKWVRESVYFVGMQTIDQWRRQLRGKRGAQLELIVNSRLLRKNSLVGAIRDWILNGPKPKENTRSSAIATATSEEERIETTPEKDSCCESALGKIERGAEYAPFELSTSDVASYGYADAQLLREDLKKAAATGGEEGPCFTVVLAEEKRDNSESNCEGDGTSSPGKGLVLRANKERALKVVSTIKLVEKKLENLDEHLGMAEILLCIQQAGCPIVVHNGMMDLIHLIQQFHGSTPTNWIDYKKTLKTFAPGGIFDTKVIASELSSMKEEEGNKSSLRISFDTSLQQLHDTLVKKCANPLEVYHEEEYSRYCSKKRYCHEAGYDAYLTGYCFASLLQCYGSEEEGEIVGMNPTMNTTSKPQPSKAVARIPKFFGPVNEWHNKIHVMNSDYAYFDLDGEDPEPERDNCVHIRLGKNKQISTQELLQSFRKCGIQGSMNVLWFERQRQEALVRLPDYKAAAQALQLLKYANQSFSATSYKVWRMGGHKQQHHNHHQHMNHQRGAPALQGGPSRKRGRDMSDDNHYYQHNNNKRVYRRPAESRSTTPRGGRGGRGRGAKSPSVCSSPLVTSPLKPPSHQVGVLPAASNPAVQYLQQKEPPGTKKMDQEQEEGEIPAPAPAIAVEKKVSGTLHSGGKNLGVLDDSQFKLTKACKESSESGEH